MIDIDFIEQTKYTKPSDNSLLIIGKGESLVNNTKIFYPSTLEQVQELYGVDSQLTIAYKEAKMIGATEVYLCNCYRFTDYINILDLIAQNDFAYITPLFDFSNIYIDPDTQKEEYLAKLYTNYLNYSFSTIFFTDKHAKYFENIDHFLNTMKAINYKFKESSMHKMTDGSNMCFVLNTLKNYKFANVALASIIASSNLRQYPQKDIGECVFDLIDADAFDHEFVFFQYDNLAKTTIENLLNYYDKPSPEKMLIISLIKNKINHALDYTQFSGRLINAYTKIELENYTKQILQSFVGKLIEKFYIEDIVYYKESNGEVSILIKIVFKPYHSIEEISMGVEL